MGVECAELNVQPEQNEVQALVRIGPTTRRMLASWFDVKGRTTTVAEWQEDWTDSVCLVDCKPASDLVYVLPAPLDPCRNVREYTAQVHCQK